MFAEERIVVKKKEFKPRKLDKIRSWISWFAFILIGGIFGYSFMDIMDNLDSSSDMSSLVMIVIFLPSVVFSLVAHIALHELGHVIMAILTGYKFHSYRIFSLMLKKENGKWVFKRYTMLGTAGQAIMAPPQKKEGSFPWFWYNLGGGLMNFILSLIALAGYLWVPHLSAKVGVFLLSFILIGIVTGLTNLIPLAGNDGNNMLAMYKDEIARDCFYKQLDTMVQLDQDKTFKDLPLDNIILPKEANLKCPLIACLKIHELEYYYDIEDYNSAIKLLNEAEMADDLVKSVKIGLKVERLFIECLQGPREEVMETLCEKEVLAILKQGNSVPDFQRVLMAYEGLYNKDFEKAMKHYQRALKLLDKYPIQAVKIIERRFLSMILEQMEKLMLQVESSDKQQEELQTEDVFETLDIDE